MVKIESIEYQTALPEFVSNLVKFLNECYVKAPYNPLNPWEDAQPELFLCLRENNQIIANQTLFRLRSFPENLIIYGLGDLAVSPAHRHHGHAERLIQAAITQPHQLGASAVLTNSETLYPYFKKLGFMGAPSVDEQFVYYNNAGEVVEDRGKLALCLKAPYPAPIKILTPVY